MQKAFLMSTVDNRIESLLNWVQSAKGYISRGWGLIIVAQAYTEDQEIYVRQRISEILGEALAGKSVEYFFLPERIGPYWAKIYGFEHCEAQYYLIVDDDMQIVYESNYDAMLNIYVTLKDIGLMSSKEVTPAAYPKARLKKRENTVEKSIMVWTGGGTLLGKDVRDLFVENSKHHTRDVMSSDNEFALESYVGGFMNALYKGSITIHDKKKQGGYKQWVAEKPRDLLDETLMASKHVSSRDDGRKGRRGDSNEIIGLKSGRYDFTAKDITRKGHELHTKNLRQRTLS